MSVYTADLSPAMRGPLEKWLSPVCSSLEGQSTSLVAFGPAVFSTAVPPTEALSVLIVSTESPVDVLDQVRPLWKPPRGWHIEPPLVFSPTDIEQSRDVFAIELLQMQKTGRVVFGEFDLSSLAPDGNYLRLQCERELRGLVIHSRLALFRFHEEERRAGEWMRGGIAKITSILRGLLVLGGKDGLGSPAEVLEAFEAMEGADCAVLRKLVSLSRDRRPRWGRRQMESLSKWLDEMVARIDSWEESRGATGEE